MGMLEGSNDLINWDVIHDVINNNDIHLYSTCFKILNRSEYYTKFRFRMTGPNSDRNKVLRIRNFRLHGKVRRKVYKVIRVNEQKIISKFPQISTNKCLGDINNAF